jgi:hypothetical protein
VVNSEVSFRAAFSKYATDLRSPLSVMRQSDTESTDVVAHSRVTAEHAPYFTELDAVCVLLDEVARSPCCPLHHG